LETIELLKLGAVQRLPKVCKLDHTVATTTLIPTPAPTHEAASAEKDIVRLEVPVDAAFEQV
jgi:hypothetical protein